MKSMARRHVSILIAGFCLFGFFPFYALGFIGSDSGPVAPSVENNEGAPAAVSAKKAAVETPVAERDPLLVRFAPEAGWGQARRDQIKIGMIQGRNPTAEEREFFLSYSKWLSAHESEKSRD